MTTVGATSTHTEPVFRVARGTPVARGALIATGNASDIYEVADDSGQALKWFRGKDVSRDAKLRAMLGAVPLDAQRKHGHASIAWPDDLVRTATGSIVGYVMPRLDSTVHRPLATYWNPGPRSTWFPGLTWKYLCVAAANTASLIDAIHLAGHAFATVDENRFLVNGRALVTAIDCDAMQIRDRSTGAVHRAEGSSRIYHSPEALARDAAAPASVQDDAWSLTILLFRLLMEGAHPAGDPDAPGVLDRIVNAQFPLLEGDADIKHGVGVRELPQPVHELFVRCFRDGFSNPEARPLPREWRQALQRAASTLKRCAASDLHWHAGHLRECPWCAEHARFGFDRFAVGAKSIPDAEEQTELPPLPSAALSTASPPLPSRPATVRAHHSSSRPVPATQTFGKSQTGRVPPRGLSLTHRRISEIPAGLVENGVVATPDNRRVAFVGRDTTFLGLRTRDTVVVDGVRQQTFDAIVTVPGFSPDGRSLAYCGRRDGKHVVMVNDVVSTPWDDISIDGIQFSRDGRHSYAAMSAEKWSVVIDGVSMGHYDGVLAGFPIFSPDGRRFAYGFLETNKWRVVIDDEVGEPCDGILKGAPVFSNDSSRVAYAYASGPHWFVVIDGQRSQPYDEVLAPQFSPDSRHVAYGGKTADRWTAVIDGVPGPEYDYVGAFTFSANGARVGYCARYGGQVAVVVDGIEIGCYENVTDRGVSFSADGRRVAYGQFADGKWTMMIDGHSGPSFTALNHVRFSNDGRRTAYFGLEKGDSVVVVVDEKPGKGYEDLLLDNLPEFSPDGGTVVYGVSSNGKQSIVIDGVEGTPYDAIIGKTMFSSTGKHVAYVGQVRNENFLVVDGVDVKLPGTPMKSSGIVFDGDDHLRLLVVSGNEARIVSVAIQ